MFERLGLGVELDLRDNMTSRVNPIIRDLERLQRASRETAGVVDYNSNRMYSSMTRGFNRRLLGDYIASMRSVGDAANHVTRRLVSATVAAERFSNATNRMQLMGNFSRMYADIFRVQNMLGNMGYGMSRLQREMSDTRAFNMLNYQMKDLQDRINLTRNSLERMQRSPDSSKFRREIALAQRALQTYEAQLRNAGSMQQKMADTMGYTLMNLGGKDTLLTMQGGVQGFFGRIYGGLMNDVARVSMSAYRSLDTTAKKMVGLGYTTMEARQKVTALATSFQMLGGQLSMFLTVPVLAATAALTTFLKKAEEAHNTFSARTLVPMEQMNSRNGYRDLIDQVSVDTGATQIDTSNAFSASKIALGKGASIDDVTDNASNALFFNKVWGVDTVKSMNDVSKIAKEMGVSMDRAWDMYVAGAQQAEESGRKFTSFKGADEIQKAILSNKGFYMNATKDGGDYQGATQDMITRYDEQGGLAYLAEVPGMVGNIFKQFWYTVEGGINSFSKKFNEGVLGNIYSFVQGLRETHPDILKWTTAITGLGIAFAVLVGPIMAATGFMVMYRNILQGVGASIFGLGKGGLAVLPPQAMLAKQRMDALIVAIARFPQTIMAGVGAIYTFAKSIPFLIGRILAINPMIAIVIAGITAYVKNWGGFRDTVNGYVDNIKDKWGELVEAYKNSSLPATFKTLSEYAKAFAKGFMDGMTVIIDIGKYFINFVIEPLRQLFIRIDPVITAVANGISKLFGGKGDLEAGVDKWERIGKIFGTLVGGFLALKGVMTVTSFLISPFVKMNNSVKTVGTTIDRLISRMAVLGKMGFNKVVDAPRNVARAVGSTARTVGRAVYNNPNPALMTSTQYGQVSQREGIVQRAGTFLMSPFSAMQRRMANGLATMGVGNGVAMGRQMTQARQDGRLLRNNSALLDTMRNSGYGGANGLTATGSYRGRQVYTSGQGAISRALLGQRMYTYNPVRNEQGQITGYSRNSVGTTGGLLRSATNGFLGLGRLTGNSRGDLLSPNSQSTAQRLVTGTGNLARNTGSAIWNSMPMAFARARTRGIGNAIATPFRAVGNFNRRMGAGAFNMLTQNRLAGGLASAGRWAGSRLQMAGIRNPFAGALNVNNAQGPMTRGQVARNFVGRTMGGMGSLAMAGAGMVGRGAVGTTRAVGRAGVGAVRGVGRGIGAVGRGIGAVGGGLMAAAPWLLAAGIGGKLAYDKLGKGADGKKSVGNVAGNLDKITAGIGKDGGKGIEEFWKKFKKYGGDIIKSVAKLITASLKALAPKIPGMLKDAWNGVVSLAKWAWNWIKTDGLAMAKAAGNGLMKLLGAAWEWVKTDGVRLLGELWNWFTGTAIPSAVSGAMTLLGALWEWFKTDGIRLIGDLIVWFLGTAIPNLVTTGIELLGKLWTWFRDDGLEMMWGLVVSMGEIAISIGQAIWNGITQALSGLGEWIKGLIPSVSTIKGWISDKFGGGKDPKKHARGGIINSPHLGIVGEAGPEAIIPLSGNMRGIARNLFQQTAGILGYKVDGEDVVPAYATGGIVGKGADYLQRFNQDFSTDSAEEQRKNFFEGVNSSRPSNAVRSNSQSQQPVSQDNRLVIEKLEVHYPESMAGTDSVSIKKQAEHLMKELQKLMKQERLRQGNKNLTLEDVILGN